MMTLDTILVRLQGRVDRPTLETYIHRAWVKPAGQDSDWRFEDIDLARVYLVHHLHRDMAINEDGLDIVLDLLDQLYALRGRVELLQRGMNAQPHDSKSALRRLMSELSGYAPGHGPEAEAE